MVTTPVRDSHFEIHAETVDERDRIGPSEMICLKPMLFRTRADEAAFDLVGNDRFDPSHVTSIDHIRQRFINRSFEA